MLLATAHVPAETNWIGILGVIGILFGTIGLVGAAIAVLRSSIATNTIKLLEANNAALNEQNDIQEKEITALQAKTSAQQAQIEMLKGILVPTQMLADIENKIDAHHSAVMALLGTR